MRRYV